MLWYFFFDIKRPLSGLYMNFKSGMINITSFLVYDVFCEAKNPINSLVWWPSEVDEIWIHNFLAFEVLCESEARLWIQKKKISLPRIRRFLRVGQRPNSHWSAPQIRIPCIAAIRVRRRTPDWSRLWCSSYSKIGKYDVLRILRMHCG